MFTLATGFLRRSLPIAIRDSMFSLVAISTDDVSPFNESSYTHIMHLVIVDDKLCVVAIKNNLSFISGLITDW
jgi:hypothetical protein